MFGTGFCQRECFDGHTSFVFDRRKQNPSLPFTTLLLTSLLTVMDEKTRLIYLSARGNA
jgi:hypothetical protein